MSSLRFNEWPNDYLFCRITEDRYKRKEELNIEIRFKNVLGGWYNVIILFSIHYYMLTRTCLILCIDFLFSFYHLVIKVCMSNWISVNAIWMQNIRNNSYVFIITSTEIPPLNYKFIDVLQTTFRQLSSFF